MIWDFEVHDWLGHASFGILAPKRFGGVSARSEGDSKLARVEVKFEQMLLDDSF